LPGVQEELLKEVIATGTPTIIVMTSGRPYVLNGLEDLAEAVLMAFQPGQEGAEALADLLPVGPTSLRQVDNTVTAGFASRVGLEFMAAASGRWARSVRRRVSFVAGFQSTSEIFFLFNDRMIAGATTTAAAMTRRPLAGLPVLCATQPTRIGPTKPPMFPAALINASPPDCRRSFKERPGMV